VAHRIVTGALVRGDRVLLGHRTAARQHSPDRWALPGGHVEAGEQPVAALVRELREELGVEALVAGPPALRLEHRPRLDDGLVMDIWVVTAWHGRPTNAAPEEHDRLRWVTADELAPLPLAHPEQRAFLRDLLARRRAARSPAQPTDLTMKRTRPDADTSASATAATASTIQDRSEVRR
jgi:8-oxo-dGTP diphosphatase